MKRSWFLLTGTLALLSCSMNRSKPQASGPSATPTKPVDSQPPASTGSPAQPSPSVGGITVPSLPARLEPENAAEKKLDANLLRVERASRSGPEQAEVAAKSLLLLDDTKRIKVDVALNDKSNVPAFRDVVASMGGQVTVALENHVFALIPPSAIAGIAARADVFSIATASATVRP